MFWLESVTLGEHDNIYSRNVDINIADRYYSHVKSFKETVFIT